MERRDSYKGSKVGWVGRGGFGYMRVLFSKGRGRRVRRGVGLLSK